jgi:hypothetical protein
VCSPVPGFVSSFIYRNDLGAGWGWRPYSSKNTVVRQPALLHSLLVIIAVMCLLVVLRPGVVRPTIRGWLGAVQQQEHSGEAAGAAA